MIRNLLRLVALGLGAVHTTVAVIKQSMNEDGIGYLDIGDALMRGDWELAVNGVWSPLYAAYLGLVINLFEPGIQWEFPTAQIANFVIYGVALVCFEFFWSQLATRYERQIDLQSDVTGFDSASFLVLGYSLFIWSSLNLIEMWAVTPDMLVAALVYLAAGLLIRLADTPTSASTALLLGITLGVGYLAKAAMMPLGLVCIALTLAFSGSARVRLRRLGLSAAGFVVVAVRFSQRCLSNTGNRRLVTLADSRI